MFKRYVLALVGLLAVQPLGIYLTLSASAGRPLGGHEASRLTGAIACAVLACRGDTSKFADVVERAKTVVTIDPSHGAMPLPPLTMSKNACWTEDYAAFADRSELDRYYVEELPAAGWRPVASTGASWNFVSASGEGLAIIELQTSNPMMTTLRFVRRAHQARPN